MSEGEDEGDDEDEHALIQNIAAGDKAAFSKLYEIYEKPIFFFIKRRLGDPHESADIFHEVMMDVWSQAGKFEGRCKVATWIFRLAHNKSVDLMRKRSVREWDELNEETHDDAPTAVDLLEAAGEAAIVRSCVAKLKAPAREVINLAFFEGLKYREIAEALDCAEGTVKARVHRAMKEVEACVRRRCLVRRKETAK